MSDIIWIYDNHMSIYGHSKMGIIMMISGINDDIRNIHTYGCIKGSATIMIPIAPYMGWLHYRADATTSIYDIIRLNIIYLQLFSYHKCICPCMDHDKWHVGYYVLGPLAPNMDCL